jgi:hypothetical protein
MSCGARHNVPCCPEHVLDRDLVFFEDLRLSIVREWRWKRRLDEERSRVPQQAVANSVL